MAEEVRDKSHGAVNLVTALIIAVALVVVGFAAWKVLTNKDDDANSKAAIAATDKQAEQDCNAQYDDKDKDFCKFASRRTGNLSYEATITTTANGAASITKTTTDGKDNSSLTVFLSSKEVASFVLLNGVTYKKDYTDNKWQKLAAGDPDSLKAAPKNPASSIKIYTKSDTTAETERLIYTANKKEPCGSLICFKYELKDPQNQSTKQFIWFDDNNYRLMRYSASDTTNNTSSDTTYAYRDITIPQPSPVK